MNLYIAILPVIGLLIYIYKKDTHKEPSNLLIKCFIFGVLSAYAAMYLEEFLGIFFYTDDLKYGYINLFISVFVCIALVEEFVKWFIFKTQVYNDKEYDESFDSIVYSVFISLGFACIENILYISKFGVYTGILRGITAIPAHAYDAVIMGYFLSYSKNQKDKQKYYLALSLLVPAITHAIYDYLITAELFGMWIIFHIFMLIFSIIFINKLSKTNKSFIQNTINYCRYCGNKINIQDNYCRNCGNKIN